jgi:hypothetical protein
MQNKERRGTKLGTRSAPVTEFGEPIWPLVPLTFYGHKDVVDMSSLIGASFPVQIVSWNLNLLRRGYCGS